MASTLASPAGSTPTMTPQSVVVLRASEPPSVGGEKVEVRTGLKTLSNDLSELLVRNLSLKRNEELVDEVEQNSSDSVSLIGRNRVNNRNSLCDTFSSVNKLIKLKRVSSDLSGYGGKSLGGSDVHSINPPPQAKFKRVEVCVQELPRELVALRKSVIVNQFDQLELDEGGEPLVIDQASSELPKVEEGIARRIPEIEPSDSVGKVVRRRAHHPAKGGRGSTLESVEEEQQRYNRRSLQWPLGLGDWGTEVKIVGQQDEEEEEEFSGDNGEERKGSSRNHFRHSWNAPGYDLLLDEERRNGEDSRRDFASIVHNLAGLRSALTNGGTAHLHHHPQNQHESASLLESPHSPQITAGSGGGGGGPKSTPVVAVPASGCVVPPSSVVPGEGSHVPVSLGGPVPRKRRLEAFLKSLVGRRPSKEPPPAPPPAPPPPPTAAMTPPPLLPSPEIKISRGPSDHNLAEMTRSRLNISTTSLSSVHQRLWSVVPLLKKDVSCTSLAPPKSVPLLGGGSSSSPPTGMRKCETVLALTHSMQTLEQQPIQPKNRLRNCASVATCSRCSSLLSLAAAGSRYSLNLSNGGFVAVPGGTTQTTTTTNSGGTGKHVGSLLRLASTKGSGTSSSSSCSANSSPCASSSSSSSLSKSSTSSGSRTSVTSKAAMLGAASVSPTTVAPTVVPESSSPLVAVATLSRFTCKLCLGEYGSENLTRISQCGCSFCTECMTAYVEFEISEGAYEVSCPDAMCPAQGIITISEITTLASASLVEKHHRYRLNREVELDKFRTWCPKAGCETICLVGQQPQQQQPQNSSSSNSSSDRIVQLSPTPVVSSSSLPTPCAVHCPTCREDFCSGCKKAWHPTMSCEENTRRLAADGQSDGHGIPFDNDLIKCCPMCAVPIEKDEGCAQMMCKRCKHVFCWYCLASLDDDFLLRHYDKGPCKNKLGHSRASVVWHRAQVIGIFAGFGILLLVASPLLLLAAPCIVCCKCRICSGAAKLEETEVDYDDAAVALQPSSLTAPPAAATSQSGR